MVHIFTSVQNAVALSMDDTGMPVWVEIILVGTLTWSVGLVIFYKKMSDNLGAQLKAHTEWMQNHNIVCETLASNIVMSAVRKHYKTQRIMLQAFLRAAVVEYAEDGDDIKVGETVFVFGVEGDFKGVETR